MSVHTFIVAHRLPRVMSTRTQTSDPFHRMNVAERVAVALVDRINTVTYRYTHRT